MAVTDTPSETVSVTSQPTSTPAPSSTPRPNPYVTVVQGLGDEVKVFSQDTGIVSYDDVSDIPAGLAVIFLTIDETDNSKYDYDLWVRSLLNNQTYHVASCPACTIPLYDLENTGQQTGSWRVIVHESYSMDGNDRVLILGPLEQKTELLQCLPIDTGYCLLEFTDKQDVVYYKDSTLVERMAVRSRSTGNWTTLSGKVFATDVWDFSFYRDGILFYPGECDSQTAYYLSLPDSDLRQIPSTQCIFGNQTPQYFLGSTSDGEEIAFVTFTQDDSGNERYNTITVCPADTALTGDVSTCSATIRDISSLIPLADSLTWLDKEHFLWEHDEGILDSQVIGTMDMDGNVRILYQGATVFYDVSPDKEWLLYNRNSQFGIINTIDGSSVYLSLPENVLDAAWLVIP